MKVNLFRQKAYFKTMAAGWAVFTALALILSCASGPAGEAYGGLGKPTDPVPFRADIRRGQLPNGLKYFILENSMPENRAYLTLAVDAGSVLEEDGEQGLAHFVEHMAFNGTTRFPELELIGYLRSLGMRFGPEINAYTTYDETVYGIEVPTETGADGKKAIPPRALAIIDDWSRAITFAPRDVDDERPVIVEENRTRAGAMERARERMLPVLFRGSRYAERRPIGLMEVVESATASQLENFYRKWYRADNMALVFVGDFDGAALEASLGEHFSIAAPPDPLVRPRFDLPAPKRGSFAAEVITDPEQSASVIYLYFQRPPEIPRPDLAHYRQGLIDILADRMLSLRFDEDTANPACPSVYAAGGQARYGESSRFTVLIAQAKTGLVEESLRMLLREKESLVRFGFNAGELELASRSFLAGMEQMVSEKDRQESDSYIRELSSHYLTGEVVPGIEWELEAARRLLPGISLKEISQTLKDYFAANDLKAFIVAPEAEQGSLPDAKRIRQIAAEVRREKLSPRKDAVLGTELLSGPPQPGSITAESVDGSTGAVLWDLSNGARVILKETKNRNNEIVIYAMARGGILTVPPEQDASVRLASELYNASGAGPYTRTEVVKKLADKQVSLAIWNASYDRGLQASSSTTDIGTLFELLYLGFTDPQLDPDAAAALLDQYRTRLIQQKDDPESLFSDEINRTLTGDYPRFRPLELEDLARVDLDTALDYLKLAMNPADYTFVFTGNLDLPSLRPLVETYLASIPPGERRLNSWEDPGVERPGKAEKNLYKGQDQRSQVYLAWFAPQPFSETASVTAQALEEYLNIVLDDDIREAQGGVYSISSWASVSPLPKGELSLSAYFICDPRRAKDLSAAVEDQLGKIAAGTIDAEDFTKAREALVKKLEDNLQHNLYIAQSYANSSVILNTPLNRLDQRMDLYRSLKPGDIKSMAAALMGKGPARITLYPEGWK